VDQMLYQPSDRIAHIKPYYFASLNLKLTELRNKNIDVIRIDMGSPDLPPPDFIIDALVNSAKRPDTHSYAPNGGPTFFREAISKYYQNRYRVELDPSKEVCGLIGSKEGLFNLSQVLVNPGDVVLAPDPGYPVYQAGGKMAGGNIYAVPLMASNNYLPDLDSVPIDVASKAKILWLNYPNNPTGAIAPMYFLEKAVNFARQYHMLLAYDAPYNDVCFEGYRAPSILEIDGAKDVCVEFNSLSKTYNMAGWRLGMAVGNSQVINYLSTYKSQVDTSQFIPIYTAGAAALTGDQDWLEERNQIYQHRRDIILAALRTAGYQTQTPPAAIYVWAHLPEGKSDSMSFCNKLLEETGVSTTPGLVYGNQGEGFLRISLGTSTERIKVAMERIANWTKSAW
jgi:LL-diaminopimelate aminotransferase